MLPPPLYRLISRHTNPPLGDPSGAHLASLEIHPLCGGSLTSSHIYTRVLKERHVEVLSRRCASAPTSPPPSSFSFAPWGVPPLPPPLPLPPVRFAPCPRPLWSTPSHLPLAAFVPAPLAPSPSMPPPRALRLHPPRHLHARSALAPAPAPSASVDPSPPPILLGGRGALALPWPSYRLVVRLALSGPAGGGRNPRLPAPTWWGLLDWGARCLPPLLGLQRLDAREIQLGIPRPPRPTFAEALSLGIADF